MLTRFPLELLVRGTGEPERFASAHKQVRQVAVPMSDISVSTAGAVVPPRSSELVSVDAVRMSMIALLVASFAVIVLGVFRQSIGGDEYIFLCRHPSRRERRAAGFAADGLCPSVRLAALGGDNEITQVTLGRLIYVALWAGSLTLLYRLGRRLLDPLGALASVVLFAVFSYSVATAADFRIDGLLLPVLLSVALLLLNPTIGRVAAAGALSGLAVAMSIKAVLWAPAFIGVLAIGLWNSRTDCDRSWQALWPEQLRGGASCWFTPG
jgi:hypothetical protein